MFAFVISVSFYWSEWWGKRPRSYWPMKNDLNWSAVWDRRPCAPGLIAAIEEYITMDNQNPKPFVWTAKANDILQKVIRANSRINPKKNEALH